VFRANRILHCRIAIVVALVLAGTYTACADESGHAILARVRALDDHDRAWQDRIQELTFSIHGRLGDRTRRLRVYEQRVSSRERRVLIRLLAPADVQNMGFLEIARSGGGSEQFLFLPEFNRVRRVSGSVKSERFIGSDLTHDDVELVTALPGWDEKDTEAVVRGSDTLDGVPCHVIDLQPKRSDVAYTRIGLWLGKQDLFVRRLDLYADGTSLTKRIVQSDVRDVDKIPVAHLMTITPAAPAENRTVVTVTDTKFGVGLSDECFSQETLSDVAREATACAAHASGKAK
jgi:outer membrane lipoprotein-sorting protein